MIRVYLDWNVISNLKKEENKYVLDFISDNKEHLLFVYSPAHFNDFLKGDSNHPNFQKDLETLEWLCGKHHIRWENDNFLPLFGTPSYYYEQVKDNVRVNENDFDIEQQFEKLSNLSNDNPQLSKWLVEYKSFLKNHEIDLDLDERTLNTIQGIFPELSSRSSLWDIVRVFGLSVIELLQQKKIWLNIRKQIEEGGLKLDINAGNWTKEEVIKNVDVFINKNSPTPISFFEYLQLGFKGREKPVTLFELYNLAYLTLDLFGYKSDKLRKPTDGFLNITTDIEHSFLAHTCDILVVEDYAMKAKTEALYHYFSIDTSVVKLNEFVEACQARLHDEFHNSPLQSFKYFFSLYEEELIQLRAGKIEPFEKALERRLLNIFDYASFEYVEFEEMLLITFSQKEYKHCNFLYFTEREYYLSQIVKYFDDTELNEEFYTEWKDNFINNHSFELMSFMGDEIIGVLGKDENCFYPILTISVDFKKPL